MLVKTSKHLGVIAISFGLSAIGLPASSMNSQEDARRIGMASMKICGFDQGQASVAAKMVIEKLHPQEVKNLINDLNEVSTQARAEMWCQSLIGFGYFYLK